MSLDRRSIAESLTKSNKPNKAMRIGRKAIDQLGIKYDKDDIKDINWLASILGQFIKYPSADQAMTHGKANKLGILDKKTALEISTQKALKVGDQKVVQEHLERASIATDHERAIKGQKNICKCCGLTEQQ